MVEPAVNRWANRTAFVTGGNSGIGNAIVKRLIDYGVNVVSLDKNVDSLEALANELLKGNDKGKLYPIKGDLRNEEDIVSAFDWVEKNLGVVHILVNNAGCGDPYTLLNFETEYWRQLLEVNVLAVAICTREAVKSMTAHDLDEGHVFNIDSICGQSVLMFSSPMYTATKFAVSALSQALRKQLAARSSLIRVTNINPGLVKTPLTDFIPAEILGPAPLLPDDIAEAVVYALSLKQHVNIADVTVISPREFDGKGMDEIATNSKLSACSCDVLTNKEKLIST